MVNICIVHYNTPLLTECLVKSINKFTPDSKIYIFDNSDKDPFVYKQDNIVYYDNTKGQIIDFNKWLNSFPSKEKSLAKKNGYASAKHCYTIDKCIELIDKNFILLDSDVLLKRDISDFVNDNVIAVGKTEFQTNCKNPAQHKIERLLPYICYINVNLYKENGCKYFDKEYMNGLYFSEEGELYDTGAGFLKSIREKNLQIQNLDIYKYIVHYGAGSWNYKNPNQWLKEHESLYSIPIIISLTSHGQRIKYLENPLLSLLKQNKKPDKIIVYIHDKDKNNIPSNILTFCRNNNIEIHHYTTDIGPHAKYFYVMQEYKYACIITVDDDIFYSNDLVQTLYNSFIKYPTCIHARRVHKIEFDKNKNPLKYNEWVYEFQGYTEPSFDLFATGVGGVLYPPNILKLDNSNLNEINKSLYADDVYLKYRELELDIPVVWVKNQKLLGTPINNSVIATSGLALQNNLKNRNDLYVKALNITKHNPMKKYVIYTCITGNYDTLKSHINLNNFDFVCFTDNTSITTNDWIINKIPENIKHLSLVKQQRYIKTHPHEILSDYEYSIWIDGNVDVLSDPTNLLDDNFCIEIPVHPQRNCIYKEAIACLKQKKDTKENIDKQIIRYHQEKFPENYGLVQSNIIIRKHNDRDCIKLMNDWWNEIEKGSHRDQLSFNYVCWKNPNIKIKQLSKDTCNSKYFHWNVKHLSKKQDVKSNNIVNKTNYGGTFDIIGCKPANNKKETPTPTPDKIIVVPQVIKRIFY